MPSLSDKGLDGARVDMAMARRRPLTIQKTLTASCLEVDTEESFSSSLPRFGPVEVLLSASRADEDIRVVGRLTTLGWLTCSRCLEEFEWPLEVSVDRLYRIGHDPSFLVRESQMVNDVVFLKDGFLSVVRLVSEELILALPMVPLCDTECRGLCISCGENLNQGVCNCAGVEGNNPFDILKSCPIVG
ncbi:MAG: DUF177 domain-containing protein [Magnetococcus sp. DMHC-6]